MRTRDNNQDAPSICSEADDRYSDSIESISNTIQNSEFLPGTFGGCPLPSNPADVISSEIQGNLRDAK